MRRIAPILLLALSTAPLSAADERLRHGEQIHQLHCMSCHDATVYTRTNRLIQSLPALERQIDRCRDSFGFGLPDRGADAVLHYLNTTYYHFEQTD